MLPSGLAQTSFFESIAGKPTGRVSQRWLQFLSSLDRNDAGDDATILAQTASDPAAVHAAQDGLDRSLLAMLLPGMPIDRLSEIAALELRFAAEPMPALGAFPRIADAELFSGLMSREIPQALNIESQPSFAALSLATIDGTTGTPALTLVTLTHRSTGFPAANFGASLAYQLDSSTNVLRSAGYLDTIWVTPTNGSETAAMLIRLMNAGGTAAEIMRVQGNGRVGINTTSPGFPLEIKSTTIAQIRLNSTSAPDYCAYGMQNDLGTVSGYTFTGSTYAGAGGAESLNFFNGSAGGVITFSTNGSEKGRFDNAGHFGVDITAPTARLHIQSGLATATYAPLKFTSGTNLTSPEAGAVEWDGTKFYITQTSGPTRQTLVYADGSIPFVGSETINGNALSLILNHATTSSYNQIAFQEATVNQAFLSYIGSTFGGARQNTMESYTNTGVDITFLPAGTELMRLQASTQRIGINTASPGVLFDVNGNARVQGTLTAPTINATSAMTINTSGGGGDITLSPTGNLVFSPSGNVKFGTFAAAAGETFAGTITIKDSGGTTRKLAVFA